MAKHFVSSKDESPRIFDNPILDFMSRVHWSVPLIFWLPVIAVFLYLSIGYFGYSVVWTAGMWVSGLLLWTLVEYLLHRFVFHFHPSSDLGKRIHFLAHGIHHDYPNDSKRLVMPPAMGVVIAIPIFSLMYLAVGTLAFAMMAGLLCGYLVYDMLHYATHHARWKWKWFLKIKEHHMVHHFQDPDNGYGVSSPFWDKIFRTTFNLKRRSDSSVER